MKNFVSFNEILESLGRNKSRSILTGFGIFWGIFMLMVLLGGGNAVKELIAKEFDGLSVNSVIVFSENRTSKPYDGYKAGRRVNLNLDDIERIKAQVPEVELISSRVRGPLFSIASYRDKSIDVGYYGVDANDEKTMIPKIRYGRYINAMDELNSRKVCYIGSYVYETLFPEGGDPCGKKIKVGSTYLTIVGVELKASDFSLGENSAYCVMIPSSLMRLLTNTPKDVFTIVCVARNGVSVSKIEPKIKSILYRAHHIDPSDTKVIMSMNMELLSSIVNSFIEGVRILTWLIGLGTIIAGAIGISNIMMVTVRERTSEIGIRRAIGATPANILSQVISESIILTLIAGCIGIVFSVLILGMADLAATKDGIQQTHFQISFANAVISLAFLTILGVLAGLAPASRAMAIKPVDAMREE